MTGNTVVLHDLVLEVHIADTNAWLCAHEHLQEGQHDIV